MEEGAIFGGVVVVCLTIETVASGVVLADGVKRRVGVELAGWDPDLCECTPATRRLVACVVVCCCQWFPKS